MSRTLGSIAAIILLGAIFLGINMLAGAGLRSTRIDLTKEGLYTLTKGAGNIAKSPKEPITLTLYISDGVIRSLANPQIQLHARRVREMLEEFQRRSEGKIVLKLVDPEPFSEVEDRAVEAGLSGVPAGNGEKIYLGLVGTNSIDGREVLPFFDPRNERLMEYEIARLIHTLADPKKPVIGIMTALPMKGGFAIDPRTRQPAQTPAWEIRRELGSLFELKDIEVTAKEIPAEIEVLFVAHPKNLSQETLFAIDQFVLKGGKLIAFVDPRCEIDAPPGGDQMQQMMADRSSSLSTLLDAWGVEITKDRVVGDRSLGVAVNAGGRGGEAVTFLPWLDVRAAQMSEDDPVTSQLSRIILASAGEIRAKADAAETKEKPPADQKPAATPQGPKATITPLLSSTEQSEMVDVAKLSIMPDPKELLTSFVASGQKRVLAARLSGKVTTAFPNGRPATAPAEDGKADAGPQPPGEGLKESNGSINVVLFADADILSDRYWVDSRDIGLGVPIVQKISDNGDLVINAVDNLCGSTDLIAIRARGGYTRPFERIVEIQRNAEQKYLAQQKELEGKLSQAEQRIAELQQKRPDGSSSIFLSDEQQKEIEKFRAEMVQTRKELRNVQLNLRKDVERLGDAMRLANIAIVPLGVTLGAIVLSMVRSHRRGRSRHARAALSAQDGRGIGA
jgi:ABC-type uncharacterized transport system involved in gliding motility auxiliary subunit